jgi:outer membrane receptor protein involved in Fe transport
MSVYAQAVAPPPASNPEAAAPAASQDLAEVVVTARRKSERLIDVPVAVSSMSGEAVARYGATQIADLAQQVPQVNLNRGAAGAGGNLQVRGVGSMANDAGVEQMVSVNVDGVMVSRARGILGAGLLDISSVEVLKGPQALFFGKNSPGGVISLNSVTPGREREGRLCTCRTKLAAWALRCQTWIQNRPAKPSRRRRLNSIGRWNS